MRYSFDLFHLKYTGWQDENEGKPVNIHALDSILQVELRKHRIFAQTAITYIDHVNHTTSYSRDDSSFYRSAWHTSPITFGITGEITLTGFARHPALSVIRKDAKRFAIVFTAWAIVTGFVVSFTFLNKKRAPVTSHPAGNQSMVTGDVLLDADKLLIVYQDSEIKLTH